MPIKKDLLKAYKQKRNFAKTPEPSGNKIKKTKNPIFVIQKHDASHLHYDFRLEIDGVLKSWAVPKGPSNDPDIKRLAIRTEDHPMSYANFEGTIPKGEYGGGTVKIWDHGTYQNIKEVNGKIKPIEKCLEDGQIEILLKGKKLKGAFVLIKTHFKEKESWLFKKIKNYNLKKETANDDPQVKVDRHLINITNKEKILFPKDKITKGDLVNYYYKIGRIMLSYSKNRALTMHRFPNGIHEEGFYHKDAPDFFPEWIKFFPVLKKDKTNVNYVVANNVATLVYLANFGCITPHLWLSKIDKIDYPDQIIFDLDPSDDNNFINLCKAAKQLKKILENIGLTPFVKTTGSRGLHVVVPIKRAKKFDEIRAFANDIAQVLIKIDPENLTMEVRKEKRKKKIFIDTLRNSFGATAVAPYAIRAKDGAPIATPLEWKELNDPELNSQKYNMHNIFQRLEKIGDPWHEMTKYAGSVAQAQKTLKTLDNLKIKK